jgi:hypothetical protein
MSLLARLRQWFAGAKAEPDAALSEGALSEQDIAGIAYNAQLVREQLSGLAGHDLPPGRDGVKFLDGFLDRNRGQLDDATKAKVADMAGCYLGAALIAEFGGRWIRDQTFGGNLAVEVTPQLVCYPLTKAHKHVFDGPGDSVRAFFNSVVAMRTAPDDPPTEGYLPLSAERLAAIERAVQAAQAKLVPEHSPGRPGVEMLDALIERRRGTTRNAEADAKLAASAGYYYGASVVAAGGGRWINFSDEYDVAIELPRGDVIFPIELAAEHLSEGSAKSLLSRFDRFATP